MHIADISVNQVDLMLQLASSRIVHHDTVYGLLQRRNMTANYLPTGINRLDPILCGGLILGTITEVCGPPGIGKTQFCMSCCASALIHSTNQASTTGGVLYFDTELKFSIDRLIEIISNQMPSKYNSEWAVDAPHRLQDLLKELHLRRPVTCSELLQSIENIEDYIIEHKISLVCSTFSFLFFLYLSLDRDRLHRQSRKERGTERARQGNIYLETSETSRLFLSSFNSSPLSYRSPNSPVS
jgi:RecA/RadA recombinase